jgi:hypothetical protein
VSRLAIGDRVTSPTWTTGGVVTAVATVQDGTEAKVEWPDGQSRWYPVGMLARKRGRPPRAKGADDGTRCVSLSIRLHPIERAGVEAAAKAAGLSVADYVRGRLVTP